jgi:O-antigen/teichoic acid export membrane protein
MPACFLQAALAGPALQLLFEPQWKPAGPLIQLLSVGLAFDASSWAAGALLGARGEFRRGFVYALFITPTLFLFITLGGLAAGPLGVATSVVAFYILTQPVYCYFVFSRVRRIGWGRIATIYAAPVAISAVTVGGAALLARALSNAAWFQLVFVPMAALPLYAALLRVFCPELYRRFRERTVALAERWRAG